MRLEVRIEPELPAVVVDVLQIEQVVINLVRNAGRPWQRQGATTVRCGSRRSAVPLVSC